MTEPERLTQEARIWLGIVKAVPIMCSTQVAKYTAMVLCPHANWIYFGPKVRCLDCGASV